MINYSSELERIKHTYDDRVLQIKLLKKTIARQNRELDDYEQVRAVFKQAAVLTQNKLSSHIEAIVTKTIKAIFFEKDIEFKVKFVERRNKSECDLIILENGHEYNVLDDRGHGLADIVSMALRVAYILLDKVDNVLIMDEPFRNLDIEKKPYASKLIKELSREFDMQFIIITHIKELVQHADQQIHVVMKNGKSNVRHSLQIV